MIAEELKQKTLSINIVWAAISISIFIYGIVLTFVGKSTIRTPDTTNTFHLIMFGIGCMSFLISFFFFAKRKGLKTPISSSSIEEWNDYLSKYIALSVVAWALNSSAAVFGFALTFLANNFLYYVVLGVLALFFNFLMRPEKLKA